MPPSARREQMRSVPTNCVLSGLLAASAVGSLLAQTPPTGGTNGPSQISAPAIKVETRVVLLDVVVTNHRGETIPNLQRGDFLIEEDGKPQTISAFDEHKRDASPPLTLPLLPPNVFSNVQAVPPSDSVNVLLIDLLNTQPWFQKDVCNQAIKYLRTVPPGTRLAIFTLNSQQIRLVRGFTTDFSGLSVALDDKKSGIIPESSWLNPTPSRQAAELASLEAMIMMQAAPAAVDAVQQRLGEEVAARASDRTELTLQAFQHLARYLSGIPARKNVVWFADSFPISFIPNEKSHAPQHQQRVRQTSDMLTAAQIAIYPVSAHGLAGDPTFEVTDMLGNTRESMLYNQSTSQIAAETIAQETGGRAFYNTNALDAAMAKAIDEGSHYYTLAYSPTNAKNDGKYRRIAVKLKGSDYKLSYRRGYYADQPESQQAGEDTANDPLIPLVGFGMPNFDQITYRVQVAPVNPQPASDAPRAGLNTELKTPFTRYGVDVLVSLDAFAFAATLDGIRHGQIEAMFVAYDREGKIANIVKRKSRLALEPAVYGELKTKGLPFHMEIDVPTEDIYLRTGIYDLGSGNAGTLGFPLPPRSAPVIPPQQR
jgi:VWFA-related protein